MGHLVAKQNALKCLRLNTLGGVGCPGKEASAVLLETVVSAVATSGAAGSQTVNHSGDPHEGKFSVETLERLLSDSLLWNLSVLLAPLKLPFLFSNKREQASSLFSLPY